MSNNNNRFGPVSNEQPDFWQRGYATRDGHLLDGHFDHRSRGHRSINGQDSSINAYAIPKGMKVKLIENPTGGIPKIDGGALIWDENYVQAQSRLLQNGQVPNLPDPYQGQRPDGVQEVDIGNIMAQRMMNSRGTSNNTGYQKLAPAQQQQHGPMPGYGINNPQVQQGGGNGTCQLQEGHTFFQALNIQGFGTTTPLAKTGGQIKGVQGREFKMEGVHQCYVVDGLQTIDLSKMEPARQRTLVRVTAPLLGTFLVPQEAIITQEGGQSQGRQLLIDTNQSQNLQGRQQWMHQQQQAQQAQQQQQLIHTQQMQQQGRPQQQQYQQQYREQQQQMQQQQAPQQRPNVQQMGVDLLRRRGILKG